MPVAKGRLKPADEKVIQANYQMLIDNIDGLYFTAGLFSKFVFTADDKEEINCQQSRDKRTQVMLDKLLNSGPGQSYNEFFKILNTEYPHIADLLKSASTDESVNEPDYSWIDSIPDTVKHRIITDADASRISPCFDANWRHVIIRLGVAENKINLALQQNPYGSITNVITSLLIKWKQQFFKSATIEALLNVLKEVDKDGSCTINWECVINALGK